MDTKHHASSLNAKDFNYLLFLFLIIAFIGAVFQQWNGVNAGLIYSTLLIGGVTIGITLVHFFLKDDNTLKPITNYIKIPISTKLSLAIVSFITGFFTPIIFSSIVKKITSFSITSLSIPLFSSGNVQSFAVAKIEESMAWKIFNIMFVAGTIESFVYSYILPIVGILVALSIYKLATNEKPNKYVILAISMAFSTLLFVLSHMLNNNYQGKMFFIAGLFLLVSNLSIYLFGFFLMFWIGYHASNNLLFLIQVEGLQNVLQGFISWFGVFFIFLWMLMIYHLIMNWDKVVKDLKEYFS